MKRCWIIWNWVGEVCPQSMSCNIPVAVTFDGFILCGAEMGKREQLYIKYKTIKYEHKSLIETGFIMSFLCYTCALTSIVLFTNHESIFSPLCRFKVPASSWRTPSTSQLTKKVKKAVVVVQQIFKLCISFYINLSYFWHWWCGHTLHLSIMF